MFYEDGSLAMVLRDRFLEVKLALVPAAFGRHFRGYFAVYRCLLLLMSTNVRNKSSWQTEIDESLKSQS